MLHPKTLKPKTLNRKRLHPTRFTAKALTSQNPEPLRKRVPKSYTEVGLIPIPETQSNPKLETLGIYP